MTADNTRLKLLQLGAGDPVVDGWLAAAADVPDKAAAIVRQSAVTTAGADWLPPGEVFPLLQAEPRPDAAIVADAAGSGALYQHAAVLMQTPVLAPMPIAVDIDTYARQSVVLARMPRPLLSFNAWRAHEPLAHARATATDGSAGPLFSFYIAHRARGDGPDIAGLLLPALDYVLWCGGGRAVETVWATRRERPDALIAQIRLANNLKGTIEVSRTLPASFPGATEIEIDLFCRDAVLRAMPLDQSVTAYTAGGVSATGWWPDPGVTALAQLAAAAAGSLPTDARTWRDDGPVLQLWADIQTSIRESRVVTQSISVPAG